MREDPCQGLAGNIGTALLPEELQRGKADHAHAGTRKACGNTLVEAGPAAIAGEHDGDASVACGARRNLGERQVGDVIGQGDRIGILLLAPVRVGDADILDSLLLQQSRRWQIQLLAQVAKRAGRIRQVRTRQGQPLAGKIAGGDNVMAGIRANPRDRPGIARANCPRQAEIPVPTEGEQRRERPGGCLGDHRIGKCRAAAAADDQRRAVIGVALVAFDPVRQLLEMAGGIGTRFVDHPQAPQVGRQIDTDHACAVRGQRARQGILTCRPALGSGKQEDRIDNAGRRSLHMHVAEQAVMQRVLGGVRARQGAEEQQRQSRQDPSMSAAHAPGPCGTGY